MRKFTSIVRALADESRLRVLAVLRDGELCACTFHDVLGLAQSTASKHLSILANAGLIVWRKKGRWRFYSLPGHEATSEVRGAISWVLDAVENSEQARKDRQRRKEVSRKAKCSVSQCSVSR